MKELVNIKTRINFVAMQCGVRGTKLSFSKMHAEYYDKVSFVFFLMFLSFLFVVKFEPAPSDLFFMISFSFLLISGRIVVDRCLFLILLFASIFILFNFIPSLFWKSAAFGLRYLAITLYLMILPLVMSHFVSIRGEEGLDKFYAFFFFGAFLSALIGLMAVLGVAPGPADLYFRSDDGLRLSPLFKDPNVYGPFMGSAGVLALGYSLRPSCSRPILGMIFSFSFLGMMFLTFSRGAWIGTAGALFFMAIFVTTWTRRRKPLLIFGSLLAFGSAPLIIIGSYLLVKLNLMTFLLKRFSVQSYDSDRFSNWRNAISVIESSPMGVGPGHYVGRKHFPESDFSLATHNVYLKIAAENGWLGALAFFSMVVVLLWKIFRTLKAQDDRQVMRIAVACVIIGQFGTSIAVDSLHWRHLFVALGFGCCELILYYRSKSGGRTHVQCDLPPRNPSP